MSHLKAPKGHFTIFPSLIISALHLRFPSCKPCSQVNDLGLHSNNTTEAWSFALQATTPSHVPIKWEKDKAQTGPPPAIIEDRPPQFAADC